MKRISNLISLLFVMLGCSGQQITELPKPRNDAPPVESIVEDSVQPEIYIETKNLGFYVNHGRHLESDSSYTLDGVNGCNAIFMYAQDDQSSEGAITHYQGGKKGAVANAKKWEEFFLQYKGLRSAQSKYATIFYAQPIDADSEIEMIDEIYFLTTILKILGGKETNIRYMPYPMTMPGTNLPGVDPSTPSLMIDFDNGTLTSEWHGQMRLSFDSDGSYKIPVEYISKAIHDEIRDRVLGFFGLDETFFQ